MSQQEKHIHAPLMENTGTTQTRQMALCPDAPHTDTQNDPG